MNRDSTTPIYSISALNQEIRYFLEEHIAPLWVTGEVSNFVKASSGHWYFTLKDPNAALRCACFQARARGVKTLPENGMQILAHGRISLYETRGEYQFIVDMIEPSGDGLLQKKFNELKEKLYKKGLFDAAHKKPLPTFPETIGVVTSPTGAAIQDILHVLNKRFPLINVILYPAAVQGKQAAPDIAQAIRLANSRKECNVLIVGRGGGSLEDLWPFNEEIVAQAIFESEIPIVSAVGHEIDFTIADFVADARAPTPSAAAAILSPDKLDIEQQLLNFYQRLKSRHPEYQLEENQQKLDRIEQDLYRIIHYFMTQKEQQLSELGRSLHAMSPLAVLDRGYAFLENKINQQIITSIHDIKINEKMLAKLKDGELSCTIESIIQKD